MTILIVDDFNGNRALLRTIFSHAGFEVLEAADGIEALRVIEREPVDIVLSDILMPNMDGYRLCTEIRQKDHLHHVPFLFYTSTYTSPSDEALALSLGADGFIRKPVPTRYLIENVRNALSAPRPVRETARPPEDLDLTAEYTQRLVEKLEEKNEELFARTQEARGMSDQLNALILAAPVAIVSFDSGGVIQTWNPAAERIFGWTEAEVKGRTPAQAGIELDEQVPPERGTNQVLELTRRRRDGSVAHVELSAAPLHDAEGNAAGRMAVFADITERKKTEEALEKAKASLEVLSRRLLATGEAELRRIARELHDEIGQGLTAAKLEIEAARGTADPAALSLRLDDCVAVIDHLLQSVRTLSLDLHPASLDELGLVAALRAHVQAQAARARLSMLFEADELPRSRNAEVEIACFRVVQEAVTNIIRHAGATAVEIELRHEKGEVRLVVQDNGVGFDTALANTRAEQGMSFGLLSMRERAQLAGGRFFCSSVAGRGTRIEAYLPW